MLALALVQALTLAGAPCALPPQRPEGAPFASGELLAYDLELAFVKTGKMSLQVDRPMTHGEILPLKARAQTTAAVANIRRITAVGLSWVDATTLRPERYHEEGEEDGQRRSLDVRIPKGEATVTLDQRWREKRGLKTFQRQGEVLDVLSALYYLRSARLEPGGQFCLDMVGGGRYWRVTATVAPGHEPVQTPAGRFETIRVDAEAARADLPRGARGQLRKFHVWLTNDARRLPVSMVGEVDVGPISATLTSWRGAATP